MNGDGPQTIRDWVTYLRNARAVPQGSADYEEAQAAIRQGQAALADLVERENQAEAADVAAESPDLGTGQALALGGLEGALATGGAMAGSPLGPVGIVGGGLLAPMLAKPLTKAYAEARHVLTGRGATGADVERQWSATMAQHPVAALLGNVGGGLASGYGALKAGGMLAKREAQQLAIMGEREAQQRARQIGEEKLANLQSAGDLMRARTAFTRARTVRPAASVEAIQQFSRTRGPQLPPEVAARLRDVRLPPQTEMPGPVIDPSAVPSAPLQRTPAVKLPADVEETIAQSRARRIVEQQTQEGYRGPRGGMRYSSRTLPKARAPTIPPEIAAMSDDELRAAMLGPDAAQWNQRGLLPALRAELQRRVAVP